LTGLHCVGREYPGMVLADSRDFRVIANKIFKSHLIFDELPEVYLWSKFPGNISASPESDIPVTQCLLESVLKCGHHSVNVKCLIVAQMAQVRGENQAVFRGFAGYIDSDLGQMRPKPCYHRFAIEVKAAMFLLKPRLNHRSNHRDVARRRTLVHETLMAEACCFHATEFYITPHPHGLSPEQIA
jgi:hypothetical protein